MKCQTRAYNSYKNFNILAQFNKVYLKLSRVYNTHSNTSNMKESCSIHLESVCEKW